MPFLDLPDDNYLDDAIIEDTVHCDFCGSPWALGGHEDGICIINPNPTPEDIGGMAQLKLCLDCAMFVSLALKQNLEEKDICEHGVCCGDWCEPCSKAYKQARIDNESH